MSINKKLRAQQRREILFDYFILLKHFTVKTCREWWWCQALDRKIERIEHNTTWINQRTGEKVDTKETWKPVGDHLFLPEAYFAFINERDYEDEEDYDD